MRTWKRKHSHPGPNWNAGKAGPLIFKAKERSTTGRDSALAGRVKELEGQVEALMARVLKLTQQVYGRRSELSPKEKVFMGASPQIQNNGRRGQQQGAKGHGRRKYLNLSAREEIHDVFEADRHCPRCGLPYDSFPGDEISEQID